jgi:sugar (pentulose or hexulose) kinase
VATVLRTGSASTSGAGDRDPDRTGSLLSLSGKHLDGATGAALGAGVGSGVFGSVEDAFKGLELIKEEIPVKEKTEQYQQHYQQWRALLEKKIS